MPQVLYRWEFSDEKKRSSLWYIVTLSIVLGLAIWGILTRQYGMSFIVLLLAGIFYFVENNSDDIVHVEIKDNGIKISESFYDYSKIQGYSFVYQGENVRFLRLVLKKQGIAIVNLTIEDNMVRDIQNILSQFVEESDKSEITFSEKLIDILKL